MGNAHLDQYLLAFFGHLSAEKLHRERRYKAIWAIGTDYAGFAAMRFKERNPKIPFLLSLQDQDNPRYFRKKVGIADPWFRKIFTLADHIHCVNDELVEWARRIGSTNEITVLPNGVDFESFYKGNLRDFYINELKDRFGINQDEKVILAGPSGQDEELGNLVKAVAILRNIEKIPVKVVIFGVKRLNRSLKKVIKSEEMENSVICAGILDHKTIPNYFWISSCFLSLSGDILNFSIFLEAMAAKSVVLVDENSKLPAFFKNQENGFLCNIGNSFDLAVAIKDALSKKNRAFIIANGEKIAREQYSWGIIKIKIEKIFDSLFKIGK